MAGEPRISDAQARDAANGNTVMLRLLQLMEDHLAGLGTPTIAPGDVEIGAIEVKDGVTDTRATVKAGNALVVADPALAVGDANTLARLVTIDGHVDGLETVMGVPTDAAVVADANGTIQQYLRGLVKIFADVWVAASHHLKVGGAAADGAAAVGNPVIIAGVDNGGLVQSLLVAADGSINVNTNAPVNAAAAVITDANGTSAQYLRGIVALLASVIDATLGVFVMRLKSDVVTGALFHLDVTLSATPETLTTVTIPDSVRGLKMYSTLGSFRFALNEAPATPRAASSSTTIAAAAFGIAGTVWTNIPETRLLPPGVGRTIQLRSGTASNLISMELF